MKNTGGRTFARLVACVDYACMTLKNRTSPIVDCCPQPLLSFCICSAVLLSTRSSSCRGAAAVAAIVDAAVDVTALGDHCCPAQGRDRCCRKGDHRWANTMECSERLDHHAVVFVCVESCRIRVGTRGNKDRSVVTKKVSTQTAATHPRSVRTLHSNVFCNNTS